MTRRRERADSNRSCVFWAIVATVALTAAGCSDAQLPHRSIHADGPCSASSGVMLGNIAYATRSSIEVITPSASGRSSVRTIGEPSILSVACDRDRIAYVAEFEHVQRRALFIASISGGSGSALRIEDEIGGGAPRSDCPPAWSPDDRWLAIGWQIEDNDNDQSHVLLSSPLSDEIVTLNDILAERPPTAGTSCPSWSPDGRYLAMTLEEGTAESVWIVDLVTGDTVSKVSGAKWPAWSPDGTLVAFSLAPGGIGPSGGLGISDSTGKNRKIVSDSRVGARPVWSPDGLHIAYQSGFHITDSQRVAVEISVSSPDGRGTQRLTEFGETSIDPTWSPDGQSIAWARASGDMPLSIWQAELSSGIPPVPVTSTYSRSPIWF